MTKRLIASASAAIMLSGFGALAVNPATAADLFGPLRGTHSSMPQLTPVQVWDGAYFGGFAGMTNLRTDVASGFRGFLMEEFRGDAFASNLGLTNWIGLPSRRSQDRSFGFFAGYSFQFDEAVLGFEFDYMRSDATVLAQDSRRRANRSLNGLPGRDGQTGEVTFRGSGAIQMRDLMTLRARAGYTYGSMLPFVTGGIALARYSHRYEASISVDPDTPPSIRDIRYGPDTKSGYGFGLAAGAGMDVAITENLFLRGEWQYLYFRDLGGTSADLNSFRAGAGVKF